MKNLKYEKNFNHLWTVAAMKILIFYFWYLNRSTLFDFIRSFARYFFFLYIITIPVLHMPIFRDYMS